LRINISQKAVLNALFLQRQELTAIGKAKTWGAANIPGFIGGQNLVPHEAARPSKLSQPLSRFRIGLKPVFIAFAYNHSPNIWLTDKTQTLYFQAASWYAKTKRDCRRLASCFLDAMAGLGSGSLLNDEIAQAKRRLGLPDTMPVVSCCEAGREGFWPHRFLLAYGIANYVRGGFLRH
jgi:hypothetical protein